MILIVSAFVHTVGKRAGRFERYASIISGNSIFSKVEQLKSSPEIGRIVPEIRNDQFRELIYGNYRIIYRIEKKQISILTIRHGKQILPIDEILA